MWVEFVVEENYAINHLKVFRFHIWIGSLPGYCYFPHLAIFIYRCYKCCQCIMVPENDWNITTNIVLAKLVHVRLNENFESMQLYWGHAEQGCKSFCWSIVSRSLTWGIMHGTPLMLWHSSRSPLRYMFEYPSLSNLLKELFLLQGEFCLSKATVSWIL